MAQKKPRACPRSRKRWSRPGNGTCWNLTKCGRSSSRKETSAGCGWHSAGEHAKLWRMLSETEVKPPAACCGSVCPNATRNVLCSPTFRRPMPKCCPQSSIGRRAKAREKPATSNASTIPCAKDWAASCGALCRSPRPTRCTRTVCSCFFTITTLR